MPTFFARARTLLAALVLGLVLSLLPATAAAQEGEPDPAASPPASAACRDQVRGVAGTLARARIAARCLLAAGRVSVPTPVDAAPEAPPPAPAVCPPPGVEALPVEKIVAEVFRCRLTEAGRSPEEARRVAAEALVVAACESYLDPNIVVFDGRWRDTPHPNGNRYTAAGLFEFVRWTADKFVDGGYAHVHDPVRNADAAARLYLFNVDAAGRPGWIDWACAAVNDGFAKRSVLPGWPGGPPELPAWAWEH